MAARFLASRKLKWRKGDKMTIPILYATIEGHTGRIARFVGAELRAAGHECDVIDLSDTAAGISLDGADRVILAGSVHERRHPAALEAYLVAARDALAAVPSMILSVSLSAAFEEGLEEARDYLTEMEMRTGFQPQRDMLVPGALRPGRYDYFARQVIRHVVLRGRDVDSDAREHDFTDYDALRRAVLDFVAD